MAGAGIMVPERDPERPHDDPWDADTVRWLLAQPLGHQWKRGKLMECLRRQPGRVRHEPDAVRAAAELAATYGVAVRPDVDGKTLHFFRSDAAAPTYPSSQRERSLLRKSQRK